VPAPTLASPDSSATDSSDASQSAGKGVDIETRRHVHNVLERRRREDLKVWTKPAVHW
jgi:hypothetical protein